MSLSVIILAAGRGTRMKSTTPKVLHKIANREMLNLVIDTAKELNPTNICVVVSDEVQKYSDKILKAHPNTNLNFAIQKQQLGTADAVKSGIESLKNIGDKVLVLYGDTPLIKASTLKQMIENLNQHAVCVLGFNIFEENKYGRLVTDTKNELLKIVEFKDASNEEKEITLCNSGVVAIDGSKTKELLAQIDNKNASGEYYLTDIIGLARKANLSCGFITGDENEVLGVNSRVELAKAEKIKQKEIRLNFMEQGVTLLNPKSVYFSFDTKIGNDVVIAPDVFFGVGVEVASNVEIRSFSHIEGAKISSGAIIGPFARIRPGSILKENAHIGNFVEIKNSVIGEGAKANHLSYIGDSEIGSNSNIGAGTITCNYDGYKKFKTKIGKDVFIGSNSALVAPVEIGDGAVIGAGSVITKNVDSDDLAVARGKQINLKNGGQEYHNKKSK